MEQSIKPKIKICCISSLEEAKKAVEFGADAIGLVSNMPSGPGIISDELILEIAKSMPDNISTFLLTSLTSTRDIIEQLKKVKTNTVQIVDDLQKGNFQDIRNELPHIKIIQVIHVSDKNSVIKSIEISKYVDGLLLDSGNQGLKVKELGGTGRTHDWKISQEIREKVNVPVFLAGGIKTENVKDAFYKVKPYGIDLCSGVRTNNKLDLVKLKSFFDKINEL